jgi:hypothetical protein
MTNKQLIKKLEQAYQVCRDCGLKYGVYSVGCSSVWEGVCNVCDEYKPVTETRDYGYLMTGIRKLKLEGKDPAPKPKVGDTWLRDDHPAGLYIYDGTDWVGASKTRPFSELTKDFPPERKAKIKQQSKEVAEYMFTQTQESEHDTRLEAAKNLLTKEPLITDEDLDRVMNPSYLKGKIECWFTEEEVGFLNECLDTIQEYHCSLQYDASETNDVALFESVEKKITELYQDHKDPLHPELGEHSPGILSQMQKRRGLPHRKENRVAVSKT